MGDGGELNELGRLEFAFIERRQLRWRFVGRRQFRGRFIGRRWRERPLVSRPFALTGSMTPGDGSEVEDRAHC